MTDHFVMTYNTPPRLMVGFPGRALLRRCRARWPERPSLGMYLRSPNRVGKTVTQEEVAEAAGISREWYARLENDRFARVSSAVLGRVADALMMDPTERTTLFRFGRRARKPKSLRWCGNTR